jgi:hypothetical protein
MLATRRGLVPVAARSGRVKGGGMTGALQQVGVAGRGVLAPAAPALSVLS